MTVIRTVALATLLTAFVAAPALADWQDAGQVRFSRDDTDDSASGLNQPVRTLSLTARGSDVYCEHVRAIFASGRRVELFSGQLERGQATRVDLPGEAHVIRQLDFRCRPERERARVEIAADTTDYGNRPGWDRGGQGDYDDQDYGDNGQGGYRLPPREPGGGYLRPDHWERYRQLTVQEFDREGDRRESDVGPAGTRVEAVALRPVNGDARCRRVAVATSDGHHADLAVDRYDVLRRGYAYVLDLPGDATTLTDVAMACRSLGDNDVRIEVWAKAKY